MSGGEPIGSAAEAVIEMAKCNGYATAINNVTGYVLHHGTAGLITELRRLNSANNARAVTIRDDLEALP